MKHIDEILADERGDDFASDPYSDYDIMNSRDTESWKEFEADNAPYGFGIESFEDGSRLRAIHATRPLVRVGILNQATADDIIRRATTTYCPRLVAAARRYWDVCLDEASNDPYAGPKEARERYTTWATRTVAAYRRVKS